MKAAPAGHTIKQSAQELVLGSKLTFKDTDPQAVTTAGTVQPWPHQKFGGRLGTL